MLDLEFKKLNIQTEVGFILNYYDFVIIRHFEYLVDDYETPYSADTVYKWLSDYIFFSEQYFEIKYKSVTDYLDHAGYDIDYIAVFMNKVSPAVIEGHDRPAESDTAIAECFDRIFSVFEADIREYVKEVLEDSVSDPQYSSITLTKRLKDGIIIQHAVYGRVFENIESYLEYLGYSGNTYAIIKVKMDEEDAMMKRIRGYN